MEMDEDGEAVKVEEDVEMQVEVKAEDGVKEEEMDEDQRALRALLRGDQGEQKREIEAIRVEDQHAWYEAKSEADAFKEDLANRPDEASLEDYERVPIELFGEAMLRGMGHVPGRAATRTGLKQIQPYIPESRPALLGIGAKPRPVDEDDGGKKKFAKPDKRYVPIVKVERAASGSNVSSRRASRSRSGSPPRDRDRDRREKDRDDRRTRDRDDRDYRDRDRERDRDGRDYRDRDRDRDRRDRGYDSERTRDKDRDRERRKEYDSDRDYERRRDRDRRDKDSDRRDRRR
ncbi:G-patch domain protein [Ceratobasidium sp. AG-Ba]|nr:G-patch domain protein [Ceratobasidium sp. AG-Ba]